MVTENVLDFNNEDLPDFNEKENKFRGIVTGSYGDVGKFFSELIGNSTNILKAYFFLFLLT